MVVTGVQEKVSRDGVAEGDSPLRRGDKAPEGVDAHASATALKELIDRMARRMPECAIAVFTFDPQSVGVFKALFSESPYPGAEPIFDEQICQRSFREAARIGLEGSLVTIEGDLLHKALSTGGGHQNLLASAQTIAPELA